LDQGMPQGGFITMCHVVVCNPSLGDESGQDPCFSDDGSLATMCFWHGVAEWAGLEADL
jgi:hypothetical protein